jgi:hypothetical protein
MSGEIGGEKKMVRHLISVTLTTEAHLVTRHWANSRRVSENVSQAIVYFDEFGPRSKRFKESKNIVRDRERSIAFLGTVIRDLNEQIDELKLR